MKRPASLAKAQAERAKIAALMGVELPPEPVNPIAPTESPAEISRQAEAALAYSSGHGFIRKICTECGLLFAHTPGAVAYCTDTCRAAALLKIGIKWEWDKEAHLRWAPAEEPLVVNPVATELIDKLTDVRDNLKCPVHNHMRDSDEHGAWCWNPNARATRPESLEFKGGTRFRTS